MDDFEIIETTTTEEIVNAVANGHNNLNLDYLLDEKYQGSYQNNIVFSNYYFYVVFNVYCRSCLDDDEDLEDTFEDIKDVAHEIYRDILEQLNKEILDCYDHFHRNAAKKLARKIGSTYNVSLQQDYINSVSYIVAELYEKIMHEISFSINGKSFYGMNELDCGVDDYLFDLKMYPETLLYDGNSLIEPNGSQHYFTTNKTKTKKSKNPKIIKGNAFDALIFNKEKSINNFLEEYTFFEKENADMSDLLSSLTKSIDIPFVMYSNNEEYLENIKNIVSLNNFPFTRSKIYYSKEAKECLKIKDIKGTPYDVYFALLKILRVSENTENINFSKVVK